MRVLGALAVVAIHVMAAGMGARGEGAASVPWLFHTYSFIWFATPAFAFITGALVWSPRRQIRSWPEYGSFLKRRATIVLYPYLFWTVFYIGFGRYTPAELQPQLPLGSYLLDVLKLFLLGRASFHLYFIPVVLEMYLVAPLVSAAFARRPWIAGLGLWAVGAFTTLVVKAPTSDHLVTAYRMLQYTLWLLPAAAAGGWYGTVRTRYRPVLVRIWPLLLTSGLVLRALDRGSLVVANQWQQRAVEMTALVLTLIGLVELLDLLTRNRPALAKASERLGLLAYGVYLIHPMVIAAVGYAIDGLDLAKFWVSPVFTVAAIFLIAALSFAFVWVVMLWPRTAWVFGRRPAGSHGGVDVMSERNRS
jgi:peptidoglycan/LPS O-acetylase OafA/YrhL